ncbi:hypothetical protein [Alicyclobacillus sp. SP_1]|uniref:hypothetical protein n=1 Tax=Alicyclobacillus sp. SP_1 TaxID=2942475 RepID=UPI0021588165|nr:hypothetical protein [Alicyclobacillus sp. SP_1]
MWAWLRAEDGYTFSLNLAFLSVTVGMVLLLILAWLASGLAAGTELRRAATSAAQSQVTQTVSGSNAGFLTSADWTLTPAADRTATQIFDQEVADTHLNRAFSNLSLEMGVVDNQVTVIVTGKFLPLFLQTAADRVPVLKALAAPMRVTVPVQYSVVGKG